MGFQWGFWPPQFRVWPWKRSFFLEWKLNFEAPARWGLCFIYWGILKDWIRLPRFYIWYLHGYTQSFLHIHMSIYTYIDIYLRVCIYIYIYYTHTHIYRYISTYYTYMFDETRGYLRSHRSNDIHTTTTLAEAIPNGNQKRRVSESLLGPWFLGFPWTFDLSNMSLPRPKPQSSPWTNGRWTWGFCPISHDFMWPLTDVCWFMSVPIDCSITEFAEDDVYFIVFLHWWSWVNPLNLGNRVDASILCSRLKWSKFIRSLDPVIGTQIIFEWGNKIKQTWNSNVTMCRSFFTSTLSYES